LVVTLGFASLTILSVILEWRQENRAAGSRLAGSMGLFLFAISFAHFGAAHTQLAWSKEAALHHAGLPLALLVLLQDYRFLLMDAFLRFIVNATLAAAALLATIRILQSRVLAEHLQHPFDAGVIFVSAGLLLTLFVWAHNRIQRLLTSAIFLRSNVDEPLRELQDLSLAAGAEAEYLRLAAEAIARFLHAARYDLTDQNPTIGRPPRGSGSRARCGALRRPIVGAGGAAHALLARRRGLPPARRARGGRRYLSEDLTVLARLGAAVAEHVEQLRNVQMQNLVSQAELKALQAQINPHFLFNSLNTLYGTIDRGNAEARRLVLNLADVYRYLLRSERALVEVEEELRIVRAYLEIEELRLGAKLHTEVDADPAALRVTIPLLSIQPLVENAVKHGVASRMGAGFVHLKIRADDRAVSVEVSNSGMWDRPPGLSPPNRASADQRPPPPGTVLRRRSPLRYSSGRRRHHGGISCCRSTLWRTHECVRCRAPLVGTPRFHSHGIEDADRGRRTGRAQESCARIWNP
jgi:two-component system LytT family sensor kinase